MSNLHKQQDSTLIFFLWQYMMQHVPPQWGCLSTGIPWFSLTSYHNYNWPELFALLLGVKTCWIICKLWFIVIYHGLGLFVAAWPAGLSQTPDWFCVFQNFQWLFTFWQLSDYELCIASNLVDPLTMAVSWENIGGLDNVIQEIQETVIFPFKRRELFLTSSLLQPPKGTTFSQKKTLLEMYSF